MTRHAELLDSAVARRALPDLPRRRAGDRRPGRAQPRHDRRLAVPGRPVGGPLRGLRGARCDAGASARPRAARTVRRREFHLGPYETAVGPGEMLTEIRVPIRPGAGSAYEKVERRAGDWAIAAGGAFVRLDGETSPTCGIGLTAVGRAALLRAGGGGGLRGKPPTEENLAAAAERWPAPLTRSRPTSAVRPTTSGTSRASSTCGRCAALRLVPPEGSHDHAGDDDRQRRRGHRARSSRGCCSCTSCATTCGLTGTHWGCDTSNCGACVVWMDGVPVKSCTVLAAMAVRPRRSAPSRASSVGGALDPVQQGFMEEHGLQCGFCTPGMMMTARALLDNNPDPERGRDPRGDLRASCAAAPATRTSSAPSAGPPSTPPAEGVHGMTVTEAPATSAGRQPHRVRAHAAQGGRAVPAGQRQLRRRHPAARHALRRDPAQPARPRAHRVDRHLCRRGAPQGQGGHHRRGAGDAEAGVDADALAATSRRCSPPTRCASRARRSRSSSPRTATPRATPSS